MKKSIIYIVEDDKFYKSLLIDCIEKNFGDFDLLTFNDGEECVDNLKFKPALILLDYNLPGMNGVEVLSKIKELSPDTKVIILTANREINIKVSAMTLKADGYIVKGVRNFPQIIEMVQSKIEETTP
ncbi:MAG: response regulator [Bacteroidetes bacterium]|nr:response regulator [Bacteroidia bacterium]PCH67353.1 MAG: response regulator [Bacteroidota bacterium]